MECSNALGRVHYRQMGVYMFTCPLFGIYFFQLICDMFSSRMIVPRVRQICLKIQLVQVSRFSLKLNAKLIISLLIWRIFSIINVKTIRLTSGTHFIFAKMAKIKHLWIYPGLQYPTNTEVTSWGDCCLYSLDKLHLLRIMPSYYSQLVSGQHTISNLCAIYLDLVSCLMEPTGTG
jgi:hypothetical protein